MGTIFIGTAGWSISGAAAEHFPGDGSHLQRYGQVFNCVEINSSFYRPHQPQTYARWAASVPDDFRFSVKMPRRITHDLRLRDYAAELRRFATESSELKQKLGCVLVQLPPSLKFDAALANAFFADIVTRFDCMIAFEARHASWFGAPADALLASLHITRVRADPPAGQPGPHVPTTSAAYVRLHGSPRIYHSSYDDDYLQALKQTLVQPGSWCVFDNTASGAAIFNALALLFRSNGNAVFGLPA